MGNALVWEAEAATRGRQVGKGGRGAKLLWTIIIIRKWQWMSAASGGAATRGREVGKGGEGGPNYYYFIFLKNRQRAHTSDFSRRF